MLTATDIRNLFDFYQENYCPEELIMLSELRLDLLIEIEKAANSLKNTTFKEFPIDSLYQQQNLDVAELIEKRLSDTFFLDDYHIYYCDGPIRNLFNIMISSDLVCVIDADTMEVIGKEDSLLKLRESWFKYLSFSSELMMKMINFLICLESNKNTFTEGKVKELIRDYGLNRRYKI